MALLIDHFTVNMINYYDFFMFIVLHDHFTVVQGFVSWLGSKKGWFSSECRNIFAIGCAKGYRFVNHAVLLSSVVRVFT